MDDAFSRLWHEIAERPEGPMALRFYLQPIMASIFAVRDGLKDARAGRPAYLWALGTDPAGRAERIRDGWKSVGKIFMIAIVLDTIYQLVVLRGLRPLEGLLVAVALALLPYVLLRGPVNRIARSAGSTPTSGAPGHGGTSA